MEAESSNTPAAGASDEEEEEAARRWSRGCGVAASCSAVERKENGMQLGGIGDERRRESGAKTWGEMSYLWGELAEWASNHATCASQSVDDLIGPRLRICLTLKRVN
ncbi:hypothetical protein B296_00025207 [Ensete ventricosum]|uniref:Uncharacterized protein n=1 Tax=Ensete ventricosum TaxID=4639 RepID=A0A427AEP3_ENSVE|nr:hypothetical protein B296_00025207 [Ensete ventricosum]